MQQELIEMLEKVLNWYDYIGSDSYYAKDTGELVKEAEALIEKAKNNAPAVPQGFKPVGYLRSDEFDGHTFEPINGEWPLGELLFSVNSVSAQDAGLTDEEICECFGIDGADDWVFKGARAIIAALRAKENKL